MEGEVGRTYHVSLEVFLFFLLESLEIIENASTGVLDVFLRHAECLFELFQISSAV